ncbi:MAG TPA: hypothetical protein PLO37_17410 [Candidatus Hydrogenedentes bacterium]|nr:hypothetical protein [Candidatus Hydrogenedentota bacterium]HPG68626.1 hypothetical protein [Candidatus Hydrogenedentota bacterium]
MDVEHLQTVYVITVWSGERACKKWKTLEKPRLLPTGTGVTFKSVETKLSVDVIGNVSVEEFEQGREYDDGPSADSAATEKPSRRDVVI